MCAVDKVAVRQDVVAHSATIDLADCVSPQLADRGEKSRTLVLRERGTSVPDVVERRVLRLRSREQHDFPPSLRRNAEDREIAADSMFAQRRFDLLRIDFVA